MLASIFEMVDTFTMVVLISSVILLSFPYLMPFTNKIFQRRKIYEDTQGAMQFFSVSFFFFFRFDPERVDYRLRNYLTVEERYLDITMQVRTNVYTRTQQG